MPAKSTKSYSIIFILFFLFSFLLSPTPIQAAREASDSANISATVPSTAAPTQDTDSPTTPILLEPKDGTVTNDTTPTLVWSQSEDPSDPDVKYTVFLDGVATYLGVGNSGNTLKSNFSSEVDGDEIRLTPSSALEDSEYTWSVEAYDTSGNSASSTSFHLTIDTTPPIITVKQIDNQENLNLSTQNTAVVQDHGPFFIRGPKAVYFKIKTEPYATLQATFKRYPLEDNSKAGTTLVEKWTSSYQTNHTGLAELSPHLEPDQYKLSIIAIYRAQNTSALPAITLNITKSTIKLPPPISKITPEKEITVPPLPSLPATISKIKAEPITIYPALALALFLLIVFITFKYTKKPNLLLLDQKTQKPLKKAVVFHSNPQKNGHSHQRLIPSLKAKPRQLSHWLAGDDLRTSTALISRHTLKENDNGYLYIPHLSRYSTLTLKLPQDKTIILSLTHTPQPKKPIILRL